jgi:hypothetical protein
VAKDKPDYLTVANGFHAHYQPVGYVENLWVQKIATQVFRSARLLAHEQKVLSCAAPFEERSISNLVRYQTSVNRELTWAIAELERLQEIRKGGSNPSEPSDSNEDESLDPEPPTSEFPAPDGEPSADPSTGSISAPAEGGGERLEAAHPALATHESCGTNPTATETNGQAATAVQDSDGDVPQESVPSTEPQTPVMGKNSETNPSKSLADQVAEVLDDGYLQYRAPRRLRRRTVRNSRGRKSMHNALGILGKLCNGRGLEFLWQNQSLKIACTSCS